MLQRTDDSTAPDRKNLERMELTGRG
jgi:hypothetical protein